MPHPCDGADSGATDHQPARRPRVRASDVSQALTSANLPPLPDSAPRGSHGLKVVQLLDAVLVAFSAPGDAATVTLRDRARRALRDERFMVKDSAATPALVYVIDRGVTDRR